MQGVVNQETQNSFSFSVEVEISRGQKSTVDIVLLPWPKQTQSSPQPCARCVCTSH